MKITKEVDQTTPGTNKIIAMVKAISPTHKPAVLPENLADVVAKTPFGALDRHGKEAVDLLCSAAEIARRKGEHTNWDAFESSVMACLGFYGRSGISARTYGMPTDYMSPGVVPTESKTE